MGYSVSVIKLDFPLPETPVIPINLPKGKSTLIFFKLWPVAFFNVNILALSSRLYSGLAISRSPFMFDVVRL